MSNDIRLGEISQHITQPSITNIAFQKFIWNFIQISQVSMSFDPDLGRHMAAVS